MVRVEEGQLKLLFPHDNFAHSRLYVKSFALPSGRQKETDQEEARASAWPPTRQDLYRNCIKELEDLGRPWR